MNITLEQTIAIKKHTLECYPNEMCGIITDGIFIPILNTNEKPENNFTLNACEVANYLGKIEAVVHSHTRAINKHEVLDLRTPSYADIIGQQKTNVTWLIVGTEGVNVTEPLSIPRIKNNKYLERPFIWFMNDCYSLVQDYYYFEFGIELPNHKAEENFSDIRHKNNIFDNYIQEFGFDELPVDINSLQKGDILLLDNAMFTRNHLGIYQGNGYVLHQDMLSMEEPIENFMFKIHKVLRYANKSI